MAIPEIRQIQTLPAPLRLYGAAMMTARKKTPGSTRLPDLRLVRPAVTLEASHIARYAGVCGFKPAHGVPLIYPHMLAFPLHMLLMADDAFPYSMMGMVHLANTVRQHARLTSGQVARIEVRCANPQAHEKGQAFSLLTQLHIGRDLVWESESTYLRTGARSPQGPVYQSQLAEVRSGEAAQNWKIDAGIGRRYGAMSGDLNPIHLNRVAAMAFGFPRAIAHGMWTKAHALAELMPARPVDKAETTVEFKTPLFLPGKATLWADPYTQDHGQIFEVKDGRGEKPHLRGLWRA